MKDIYLWKYIKEGDKEALKKLHEMYFHQMYLYAAKSTIDTNDTNGVAEELVSDCFIKLWENRKKIDIQTSVKHYLFYMLRNNIIDYFRKRKLSTEPLTDDIRVPGSERDFDEQKEYAKLYLAIKNLPDRSRKVLELAIFESLSYKEIAEKLQISRNTVKTQIGRAYRKLKEILDPKDFNFFLVVFKV